MEFVNQLLVEDSTGLKSYLFLMLSIAFVWLSRKDLYWFVFLGIAISLGVMSQKIDYASLALPSIVLLGALSFFWYRKKIQNTWARISILIGIIVISLGYFTHLIPGFNNWKIIDSLQITPSAHPYSAYLNFDKPLVGLLLLAMSMEARRSWREWSGILITSTVGLFIAILIVLLPAQLLGWIRWEMKAHDIFLIWALKNLFLTVIAEEVFFRGFIQRHLENLLATKRWGPILAWVGAAILFGLAHYQGGWKYVAASTLAGLIYGWAFWKTKRVEAAIGVHFGLNTLHFLFWTYPSL